MMGVKINCEGCSSQRVKLSQKSKTSCPNCGCSKGETPKLRVEGETLRVTLEREKCNSEIHVEFVEDPSIKERFSSKII